ncbi:uncharacterized protein LOC126386914 [Epinephelus moara]|uniref:uncharacterized protein LOC126386914 n=1 Tax=Epinephelus moara TaxID=300413 RepID=UPI00214E0C2D|nr:uncharacterized protein LOC126386914 [Epinephelus moara]
MVGPQQQAKRPGSCNDAFEEQRGKKRRKQDNSGGMRKRDRDCKTHRVMKENLGSFEKCSLCRGPFSSLKWWGLRCEVCTTVWHTYCFHSKDKRFRLWLQLQSRNLFPTHQSSLQLQATHQSCLRLQATHQSCLCLQATHQSCLRLQATHHSSPPQCSLKSLWLQLQSRNLFPTHQSSLQLQVTHQSCLRLQATHHSSPPQCFLKSLWLQLQLRNLFSTHQSSLQLQVTHQSCLRLQATHHSSPPQCFLKRFVSTFVGEALHTGNAFT